jgi:hypothetical protein
MVIDAVDTRPIQPEDAESFLRLMETNAAPCYCRYWEFSGDKNAWLARCAEAPEATRSEARNAIVVRDPTAQGVVALVGAQLIGWCKVSLQANKIFALSVYRRDAARFQDAETAVLGCFYVCLHSQDVPPRLSMTKKRNLAPKLCSSGRASKNKPRAPIRSLAVHSNGVDAWT